ncbi:dipeptidase [Anaerolineales bacterium]
MKAALEYTEKHFEKAVDQLIEWLKIPSISTDPAYQDEMKRGIEWISQYMQSIGLENVKILPTEGHPLVYADWLHAGEDAPTVLIYGHYDVQPAEIADGWDHDPFQPEVRDGKIFARGATDDKGQCMIQMKAIEALLASQSCPVNVKYLIEGEEEIGSINLTKFIEENKALLEADVAVISDTGMRGENSPSMVYGLRGLVTLEILLSGPSRDLHSGGYGGILLNPAQAIAEIVAQLHDKNGRVTVPGFYDDVASLTEKELTMLKQGDFTDEEWQNLMGDLEEWGESGFSRIEKLSTRPTLEVNGISGGYTGEGFKTVIPAKAKAKISCRLVPNQDPQDVLQKLKDYILSIKPAGVHLDFKEYGHCAAALAELDHPATQAAIEAFKAEWPDQELLLLRGGGSIPVVADIQNIFEIPVILLGFGLPDSQAHGPNESFYLSQYKKGIKTVIHYFHQLAAS